MVLIAFVAAILALLTGAWLYRSAISVFTSTQSADDSVALLIISFLA